MPAAQIPTVKKLLRSASRVDAIQGLDTAMNLTTAEEIERFVRSKMANRFPNVDL